MAPAGSKAKLPGQAGPRESGEPLRGDAGPTPSSRPPPDTGERARLPGQAGPGRLGEPLRGVAGPAPPGKRGPTGGQDSGAGDPESEHTKKQQKVDQDLPDEMVEAIFADTAGEELNEDGWGELVAQIFCDISGEAVDDERAKAWQLEELTKVEAMGTFTRTTVARARALGHKVLGSRFAINAGKEKARLVVQDVRRGPVSVEHWAPTPSMVGLRVVLVLAASRGHGATVVDISSAFLYADLPKESTVAITLRVATGIVAKPGS